MINIIDAQHSNIMKESGIPHEIEIRPKSWTFRNLFKCITITFFLTYFAFGFDFWFYLYLSTHNSSSIQFEGSKCCRSCCCHVVREEMISHDSTPPSRTRILNQIDLKLIIPCGSSSECTHFQAIGNEDKKNSVEIFSLLRTIRSEYVI